MEENETLALELLREVKASATRWFVAFIVTLVLWFTTIGIFVWYLTIPVEESGYAVDVQSNAGNANYIGNNGDITNGERESNIYP